MSDDYLKFKISKSKDELGEIFNFNVEAFAEVPKAQWSVEGLQEQIKLGWDVYAVLSEEDEIIAVAMAKGTGKSLVTKNSPIKMAHQGKGYSHQIKDFFEDLAQKKKANEIVSYCKKDDFRMISLNETHGYKQTGAHDEDDLLEWKKLV